MTVLVDPLKCNCKETKLCTCVCPYGFIWELNDQKIPVLKTDLDHYCIACGHCESICPSGAVTIESLSKASQRYDKKMGFPVDQTRVFLKTRRSVRRFRDRPVPKKELEDLLDIVRWIPTASNKQQVKWMVFSSAQTLQTISQFTIDFLKDANTAKEIVERFEKGDDIILRKAPHLMIALGEKGYFWGSAEAGIALTYLELYAHAKRLGTCWAGYVTRAASAYQPLVDFLELPDNQMVCGGIMVGYPVFRLHSIPHRKELDIIWR